jgi:hypothetical protein
VSHRSFQPERTAPYVVLLVRLDDGDDLVLPGGWAGAPDGSDLEMGLRVTVAFQDLPTEGEKPNAALIEWRPEVPG